MTNMELLACFQLAITSPYGILRNINGVTSPHKGTDIAVYVKAAGAGKVIGTRNSVPNTHTGLAVRGMELGNYVYIQHDNGCVSKYCHLGAGSVRVSVGQSVSKGQIVGILGNTGQSSNAHTHIQFERNGQHIDPAGVPPLYSPTAAPPTTQNKPTGAFVVGDMVKILPNALKWSNGAGIASFVRGKTLYVVKVGTLTVSVSTSPGGAVTGNIEKGKVEKV